MHTNIQIYYDFDVMKHASVIKQGLYMYIHNIILATLIKIPFSDFTGIHSKSCLIIKIVNWIQVYTDYKAQGT